MADQVSRLQTLVTEQKLAADQQKKAFEDLVEQRKQEAAETLKIKKELDELKAVFGAHPGGSPGGGSGSQSGGAGALGRGMGQTFDGKTYPVSTVKMDPCPVASKEQSMREWVQLARRWARSLPPMVTSGEGRYRAHTAIAAGLNGKPRVKTAWDRLLEPHEKRYDQDGVPFPPLVEMLMELKENVVEEEKVVAQEEFKFRDMTTDESYSEYKMSLFALAGVGYDDHSPDQLAAKVLERFLAGCGEAGPSVRLQAPKSLEEAITKSIAYDNEKTRSDKSTVYAFSGPVRQRQNNYGRNNNSRSQNQRQQFNGTCFTCKKRGHKQIDCWYNESNNNNNNNSSNNSGNNNSHNNDSGDNSNNNNNNNNNNNQRPAGRCWVCNQVGHRAHQCPNRADKQ